MDPIYYTDDYPRNGCRIEIVVPADGSTGREWSVRIYHPVEHGPALESYAPKTLSNALGVARCLASGRTVGRELLGTDEERKQFYENRMRSILCESHINKQQNHQESDPGRPHTDE